MKAKVKATGEIIDVRKYEITAREIGTTRFWAMADLEFLPDTPEEAVIEGYVVRGRDGRISLFRSRPDRGDLGLWDATWDNDDFTLPKDSFPSVTWESDPKKVRISITPIEE